MKLPVSLHLALALAGSSALSPVAAAQPAPEAPPLIEIYGTIVPILEYGHTTGATAAIGATAAGAITPGTNGASQVGAMAYTGVNQPARFRMDMGTSNLGFRGGVELMPELSVIWQIESGVQTDGTTVANTIASRNSNIGITGPTWGTLFFGSWDTPYTWSTISTVNPLRAGYIPDYNGILDNPGFGVSSVTTQTGRVAAAPDAAFNRRQGNSIQYWSPVVSGLSARLMYSIDEGRTPTTAMAPSIKPAVFGASLAFDWGPLKLREAFEAHFDYFGMSQLGGSAVSTANTGSTDWGNKLTAVYTNPARGFDTRVVGVFEFLQYKNKDSTMGAIDQFSRPALYGLVDQTLLGKHHIWVALGESFEGSCERVGGAACTTTGLSAINEEVGYLYRASKSTDFFAVYYRIANDTSAQYSTFPPLGGPAAPGVTVEAFGVGMLYTFSATLAGKTPSATRPPPPPPVPVPTPASTPGPEQTPSNPSPEPGQAPPPSPAPAPDPAPNPAPNPNP